MRPHLLVHYAQKNTISKMCQKLSLRRVSHKRGLSEFERFEGILQIAQIRHFESHGFSHIENCTSPVQTANTARYHEVFVIYVS